MANDLVVEQTCADIHAAALACMQPVPARSVHPALRGALAWSPVVAFGVLVGFGISTVLARGVPVLPQGSPLSDPDSGMVRSVAMHATADEQRPSWLAEPKHAAASSSESATSTQPAIEQEADEQPEQEAAPIEPEHSSSEAETASSADTAPAPAVRPDNKVGVYLTATSVGRDDFFTESLDAIVEAGGSSVVFDVKGSRVYFHSAAPAANEIGLVKPIYDLPAVLQAAKERGLFTIGRLVAIKDDGITGKRPETKVRDPQGKRVLSQTWVDPSNELAVQYNSEVICELAQAGIDEINLDYIRFSTADFGALKVYSGAEKADKVEVFIKAARDAINRCGPSTKLGLSTYAILGWNYPANLETLGQDVVRFAPLVDIISPMAYPATFTSEGYYVPGKHPRSRMYWLVYRTLTGYADLLGEEHKAKIRPWIQGYGITKRDMREQIDAVYAAGFCGYQVWSAGNHYTPTYAAMKDEKTRPERCGDTGVLVGETEGLSW